MDRSKLEEIAMTHTLTLSADERPARRTIRRLLPVAARIVLGLCFFVFGLDGFLHFIPPPDVSAMPEGAVSFSVAMMNTGYLVQLVKGTEVVAGVLLLANRFVPLALVILAPVIVNIVLFHAFLSPDGSLIALVVVALELFLAWSHRRAYLLLLRPRASAA
jgi:uncharacterized membrane protein YphA (DoxX/SURF4 family)